MHGAAHAWATGIGNDAAGEQSRIAALAVPQGEDHCFAVDAGPRAAIPGEVVPLLAGIREGGPHFQ